MNQKLHLTHDYDDALEVRHGDTTLFRYIYQPHMAEDESPKPYFHPVHDLAGNLVTIFRPYDHVWHKGIAMTIAHLEDQNFWGGASYRHGQGYIPLPNNGSQRHDAWDAIDFDGESFHASERLSWITQGGEHWLAEERQIGVPAIDADAGYWALDFSSSLTNVRGKVIEIGSPTTAGREKAGYGGLFWRGPRSFFQGTTIDSEGRQNDESMGERASWLAYCGRHDGSGDRSTLVFLDHPSSLRHPTQWFMRRDPFACAAFAWMFDEIYPLQPGETIRMRYRILIANRGMDADEIAPLAEKWGKE